jgi:DNA-binding transcriptional ArsR family regulator
MSARKGTGDGRRKSFACARILLPVTVYAVRTRDDLLSVRFAYSSVWETQGAVRTLADKRARPYHEAWQSLVCERVARLDLAPLLAVQPAGGYVPDFLTPPPETPRPRLRDQLAAIRASPPVRVERELERCRETVTEEPCRKVLSALLADPARARDLLAERLQGAWTALVAPFWNRIRALLERDIEQRSHALARQGLRRVLDELHPRLRWTSRGLMCDDHGRGTVELDGRGLVLMPSAYLWPHLAAIVDEPWLPTIAYPAHGIAELWRAPTAPPDALARLLGRTRALVLTRLEQPVSTTALAALIGLSPAGASRHLLALRDAGLVVAIRHGHEVRYRQTELGSQLVRGRREP